MENITNNTIHYCWFGGKELPSSVIRCINSWKKYCPSFEIVRWDESNFDINECSYAYEAYKHKKWAFVSDYARFLILYNNGGIYFDTDVELIRPIDDIIEKGYFMACQSGRTIEIAPGLGIFAPKGDSICKEIVDYYMSQSFIDIYGNANTITVVERVTKIMRKYGFRGFGEIEKICNYTIYPPDFFCPINSFTRELTITANTRAIHHFDATWWDDEDREIMEHVMKVEKKHGKYWAMLSKNILFIKKEIKKNGLLGGYKYLRTKIHYKIDRNKLM